LQRDRHPHRCRGAVPLGARAALTRVRERGDGVVELECGLEQPDAAALPAEVGMRYFHRTTLSPDEVLAQAKAFFGARLAPADEAARRRTYAGGLGQVTITARVEGGHYTLVGVGTDQVGESDLDRLAKRFLAHVHRT